MYFMYDRAREEVNYVECENFPRQTLFSLTCRFLSYLLPLLCALFSNILCLQMTFINKLI